MNLNALLAHKTWVRALSMDLLGDAQRAEDVVQETFLAALQRGEGADWSGRRMRAWLATVTRNFSRMSLRGEGRRRTRETRGAVPEAQPSASASLERLELQQKTAAAVMALGSPDREIITLRYFDELPPREIARHLRMTPSAVHSRLARARTVLRAQLEGEYEGGGKSWSVVALAWASRPSPEQWALPGALAGGLLMKAIVTTAAVSAIVLLAFFWRGVFPTARVEDAAGLPRDESALVLAQAPEDEPASIARTDEAAPQDGRQALDVRSSTPPVEPVSATGSQPPRGTVRVHVTDPSGQAAAGVGLQLYAGGQSDIWFHSQLGTTDAQGLVEFRVRPGKVSLYLQRLGRNNSFPVSYAQVITDETEEVSFTLVAGSTVRGRVVDFSGRPVAGAEVWLGDGTGAPYDGQVVTRADSAGAFEIRHIATLQGVAARAPGYAPSLALMPLFFVDEETGEELIFVELVLPDVGGALAGEVLDVHGNPLADALVMVGNGEMGHVVLQEGTPVYDPPPVRLRTDAAGRFRVDGVAAGRVRVIARALGFDIIELDVDVPRGGVGQARLIAGAPAAIKGIVRRADGRTVAGARISLVLDYQLHRLANTLVLSDAAGYFELRDVPVGQVALIAEIEDEDLAVGAELETRSGMEEWWDANLPTTAVITGRVVDDEGRPLVGWSVRRETAAVEATAGSMARSSTTTDSEGAFRFDPCPEAPQTLSVRSPGRVFAEAAAQLEGVIPGSSAVTLRVAADAIPQGAFHGRLVDPDGLAVGGAKILLHGSGTTVVLVRLTSEPDGTFQAAHLPPSEYELKITADGFERLVLDELEALAEGEQRSLGSIGLRRVD